MRQNKTIIYARLSNDDKLDDISQSIQNQISICKDYANENNLTIDEIYYVCEKMTRIDERSRISKRSCTSLDSPSNIIQRD